MSSAETLARLEALYQPMVGQYDAATVETSIEGNVAVRLAQLQPGENVLDLGTGSGRLLCQAKLAVGPGYCVGVDGCRGLLDTDFQHNVRHAYNLPLRGQGPDVRGIHLDICHRRFATNLRNVLPVPQHYDCIFAVNFLTTVPAEKLRRLLGQMRELLAPGGRIIANFPVKYSDDEPLPSERDVPTLFQTLPSLKKGVGSMVTRRTTRTMVATPVALRLSSLLFGPLRFFPIGFGIALWPKPLRLLLPWVFPSPLRLTLVRATFTVLFRVIDPVLLLSLRL